MDEKFDQIYKVNYKNVYRLSYSYVLNSQDAEDILQKTFYKLYCRKKLLKLSDEEIKKWLFRVCINESKDLLKSIWHKKTSEYDDSIKTKDLKDEDIMDCLSRIPIYLYYYEGYSIKEIAKMIHKKESAIKMRLSRGKDYLREEMNK